MDIQACPGLFPCLSILPRPWLVAPKWEESFPFLPAAAPAALGGPAPGSAACELCVVGHYAAPVCALRGHLLSGGGDPCPVHFTELLQCVQQCFAIIKPSVEPSLFSWIFSSNEMLKCLYYIFTIGYLH